MGLLDAETVRILNNYYESKVFVVIKNTGTIPLKNFFHVEVLGLIFIQSIEV